MKLLVIIAMLLSAAGCCNMRPLQQQHTITDSVTVTVTVRERDTLIIAPADAAQALFDCDSLLKVAFEGGSNTLRNQSKQASITITAQPDGRILAEARCDSLAIEAKLRDQIIKEFRRRVETITTEVPVKYTPRWVQYLAYFGGACAAFLLGAALFKLKKFLPI